MSKQHELYHIRETAFSRASNEPMCGNCEHLQWESIGTIMRNGHEWLYRKNKKCGFHGCGVSLSDTCNMHKSNPEINKEIEDRL